MAVYSSLDASNSASDLPQLTEGTGNRFLDYLRSLGDRFTEQYTRTNDLSSALPLAGADAIFNNSSEDGMRNQLEQNMQESYDESNRIKANMTFSDLINRYNNGEITALEVQQLIATNGLRLRPAEEAYLNNILGLQATESDRDYQTNMRDTSLISSYEQLLKLGMNPGSVVNLGGASSGVSSQAAKVTPSEVSKMQFERNTQMAKTLIGLAGGLASTGFHGASLGAAKFAAAKLTAEASKYATDSKYNSMISSWYDPVSHTLNRMNQKY